ncbi:DNRLRE domain-containing protein [Streptomyces sp. NPDC057950]|uniref:DNRLRE domain-containing protein n=1 Tax=Streptomyces sp. NPDC057950 TaxID=3346288 RepID=UPI0036ECF5FD
MWDASKDDASGESAHEQQIATEIKTADDGSQTLVLTPDSGFLDSATYPVTVDPTSTLAVTTDTWVQTPDYPDSQVSSQELKSGTYDSGTDTARSYLKFDVSKFKGKHITSSTMSLYSYYSSSCSSSASTQAKRGTSALDTTTLTWGAQPSTTTTNMATNAGHWGYSSSCPANWSNWTLTGMVQDWANGAANNGIQVRSSDETDATNWRRFRSANYTTSGYAPKLVVNYNSYPATPSSSAVSPSAVNAYNGKRYVTTYTPTLSAKVSDPDGSAVKAQSRSPTIRLTRAIRRTPTRLPPPPCPPAVRPPSLFRGRASWPPRICGCGCAATTARTTAPGPRTSTSCRMWRSRARPASPAPRTPQGAGRTSRAAVQPALCPPPRPTAQATSGAWTTRPCPTGPWTPPMAAAASTRPSRSSRSTAGTPCTPGRRFGQQRLRRHHFLRVRRGQGGSRVPGYG